MGALSGAGKNAERGKNSMEENICLRISLPEQTAQLWIKGKKYKTYPVSTSAKGSGVEAESFKTPWGHFIVAEKFGADAPLGAVFKSRVPTGDIWSGDPANPLSNTTEDLILTRILWLDGIEAHNANTKSRFIYIHGTNHENQLGTTASHGCVRVCNTDVIELFDLLPVGSRVEIAS